MTTLARQLGLDLVRQVVETFYARVQVHPALSRPFSVVDDWPAHIDHLTHFWWVTLGGERYLDYRYDVANKHMSAGFTPDLLIDWLDLFTTTLTDMLPDEQAEAWIAHARRIGESLKLMHQYSQPDHRPG
ncbi:group III truncated hemoglobin [Burkholderiaceae bacterium DAT-1]|nr:group III truncated hemoglobin [Burkholderiaceae bacterium DAT-1]